MEVGVAIVGGGMAGLALALGLQERGITAHVFERAAELRSDTATGISVALNGMHHHSTSSLHIFFYHSAMQPNSIQLTLIPLECVAPHENYNHVSLCIYAEITELQLACQRKCSGIRALDGIKPGLSVAMRSAGSATTSTKDVFFKEGNEPIIRTRNLELGELFVIRWKRAQEILSNLIPKEHIHLSHRLLTYNTDREWIEALFDVNDKSNDTLSGTKVVRTKILVGADGIRSAVRKTMVGDEPRDLQLVNWNALLYNPDSKLIKAHEKDQIVFFRTSNTATRAYLVDTGEGYTFWVFRVEDHNEDGSPGGFGKDGAKDRALQHLANYGKNEYWNILKETIQITAPELIFERRVRDHLPLESWTDATGRVLLIGDAAHAMFWGPGEGARTAFEDAHLLSNLLKDAFGSTDDTKIVGAIKEFERLRIPRLRKFQDFAAETTNLPAYKPTWVKELPPEEVGRRFEEFWKWARSYPNKMTGDPDSKYWK